MGCVWRQVTLFFNLFLGLNKSLISANYNHHDDALSVIVMVTQETCLKISLSLNVKVAVEVAPRVKSVYPPVSGFSRT